MLASRMPLVSSLAALVAAVRARGLDRGACGPLADRRAAAAARRELAGHLLLAVLVWRNGWMSSMITKAAACWSWCLSIMNSSITVHLARASSLDVLVLVGEVRMQAVLHTDGILLLKNMGRAWSSVRHMRPRNEVVDLDSRSVLPSGPCGLVVGFRRRGLVR